MTHPVKYQPKLNKFGVTPIDPGWIYVFKDGERFKIGKTTSPERRIREAKTWLPDMKIIGVKPFWGISHHEKCLHIGLASFWYEGEWIYIPADDPYDTFLEEFGQFCENSRDKNSISFIYWYNSIGMAEYSIEYSHQKISKLKFLKQETMHNREGDM